MFYCDTANALYKTVTNSSQQFDSMDSGTTYQFVSTVTCWIAQGSNPTAAASAGSKFCAAGESVLLDSGHGLVLAVIREGGSSGAASLTPVTKIR